MKKSKIYFSVLLASSMLLAACSSQTASNGSSSAGANRGAEGVTGSVYYLNFKPEQDAQWQELAELYTKETGVPVSVVTAAAGQYETTLKSEIAKTDAPTLFQVNGPVGLKNWSEYCYDLSSSG